MRKDFVLAQKKSTTKKRKIELRAISERVGEGERVLDLGCGRGILLEELVNVKNIYALGVDLDFEKILRAVKRGINVMHCDILTALKTFDDKSFDWIICSRTLTELENTKAVIDESLRVGKRVVIGFVNYGYWYNRYHLAFKGRRTVNKIFDKDWSCARPMNQISIASFKEFCNKNDININREHFLRGNWRTECKFFPNLFAGYALFEISK